MRWDLTDRSTRLRFASLAILVGGLLAAMVIFWNAVPNASGYDPEDSRQYLRQMEVYGGKANLLAFDFREWLTSLWHGRRLAYTVAVLAMLAAGVLRLAAIPVPPLTRGHLGAGGSRHVDGHGGSKPS